MTDGAHDGAPSRAARVCVGALLQRADGRVLLGLRTRRVAWCPGTWDMLGGHVEPGEGVEAALVRELREEAGVTPLVWESVGTYQHSDGGAPVILHVVHVTRWAGAPVNAEPGAHRALAWVSAARARRLRLADPELGVLIEGLAGPSGLGDAPPNEAPGGERR